MVHSPYQAVFNYVYNGSGTPAHSPSNLPLHEWLNGCPAMAKSADGKEILLHIP
jgi:hypothetical protein